MRYKKYLSVLLSFIMTVSLITFNIDKTPVKAAGENNKNVVHIILDGISNKLYDDLIKEGYDFPNINDLIVNGTKIEDMKTTIPSYGGAQAAVLTGAYPEANEFFYRYYDKSTNKIISSTSETYALKGETYLENIQRNYPLVKTMALGMSVATLGIEGRGVSVSDPNHKLIEYKDNKSVAKRGDKLVSLAEEMEDLKAAIRNDEMPRYILSYSNDIKMQLWNGGANNYDAIKKASGDKLKELDSLIGELIAELKSQGKYEDTIIILNSLSSIYAIEKKINGDVMASNISNATGVTTTFGTVSSDSKVVIIKNYVMKYGQLYFTNKASQEDKIKVLDYLRNNEAMKNEIKEIIDPKIVSAPSIFADYLLNPKEEYTFSQAGLNTVRTDNLEDMSQLCIFSGKGIIKGKNVPQSNLVDIVPSIAEILGITNPANNEGKKLDIFDFQPPIANIFLEGSKNSEGLYTSEVKVTINSQDNKYVVTEYDLGEGFINYKEPFKVNKDCTLKVRVSDQAGNIKEYNEDIKFVSLYKNVDIQGIFDETLGYKLTDKTSITVKGEINSDPNIKITVNNAPVALDNYNFTQVINLTNGKNVIQIEAELNGLVSKKEYIVYKASEPEITSVKESEVFSTSLVNISGKSWPKANMEIMGNYAKADEEGNFNMEYNLNSGKNAIGIKASTGDIIKERNINLYYYTPVNIDIVSHRDKDVVKTEAIKLYGKLDKAAKISINGEDTMLSVDNTFNKDIKLNKGINNIIIEADIMGVKSSKTLRIVRVVPEDKYVVYINWDGFAKYYFDEASSEGKTPILDSLIKKGVYFENASTGIPSITNAMQAAIVSGTYSQGTGNSYRYYDKDKNLVVQYSRENEAETIAEAAVRQGLKVASVHQFALQDRGTAFGDVDKAYIQVPDPSDYSVRFDEAIKLINGEPVQSGISSIEIIDIPKFMALYMDDLDGIGHNEKGAYGNEVAGSEVERKNLVKARLGEMDTKLGEFIEACKNRGIYDNMSFILTTDHGMSPYGQQGAKADEYSKSKLPEVLAKLQSMGYKPEALLSGQSAKDDTDLVVVSVGLQAQLTFRNKFTAEEVENIVSAFKDEAYVGTIMKNQEIIERGSRADFADIIISPKPPYSFKTPRIVDGVPIYSDYIARGQHDSLDETSQHIFSLMWGNGIKQGYNYKDKMYNIDFAPTMAKLLSIDAPKNSTGKILAQALEDDKKPGDGEDGQTSDNSNENNLNDPTNPKDEASKNHPESNNKLDNDKTHENNYGNKLAKTGSFPSSKPIIFIAALLIFAGFVTLYREKSLKKNN